MQGITPSSPSSTLSMTATKGLDREMEIADPDNSGTDVVTIPSGNVTVTCERDALVAALSVVSRAVSSRGAVQVLSGVLVQAQDGLVQVAATDMELSLRTTFAAKVDGEGSLVVPGKLLVDLVRLLPDPEVT